MDGIKDKVAIVGMGCCKFGENWEQSAEDMVVDAAYEAYADAGIDPKDIQAAWLGTVWSGFTGISLSMPLKTPYIPVTRVENLCATGIESLRAACYAVAAGACDIALAVGVEKLKDTGWTGLPYSPIGVHSLSNTGMEGVMPAPTMFAPLAIRYFHHYGLSREEGKKVIAQIAVKNHHNGALSPKAHFQREITLEQAMKAPIIVDPFGLFDCCGVSDGAAAAIVVRADMAKKFRSDPVYVKALSICASPRYGLLNSGYDYLHIEENVRAAQKAYDEAGIKNPLEELDVAEVHDCFTITELITYEDLGWCPRGKAPDAIRDGTFTLEGKLPVNTDGGLKCFGHPIGASGLRMMYEIYEQLQGKADKRQVKDARLGLAHNLAVGPGSAVVSICIAGR
ncbi:MAG: acetyl-CoA acetyltransferase [Dehalococcoidia bacterium]|nr:acetyl-CoA acetyltransferase [Dehalococcoidia bacterium]